DRRSGQLHRSLSGDGQGRARCTWQPHRLAVCLVGADGTPHLSHATAGKPTVSLGISETPPETHWGGVAGDIVRAAPGASDRRGDRTDRPGAACVDGRAKVGVGASGSVVGAAVGNG